MLKINHSLMKRSLRYFFYFLIIAMMIFLLKVVGQVFNLDQFLESVEYKTLDLRYGMPNKIIKHNPNIVVLSIDDESIERMQEEYGLYPWDRKAYVKAVNYLESGGVDSIIFDLMFVGHQRNNEKVDKELAKTIAENKNIYAAMNFDFNKSENPPDMPAKLKIKVKNHSKKVDLSKFSFPNPRLIMDDILKSTPNIGMTNYLRDTDGISRHAPLFIQYKDDFYPYLGFKAAYEYLNKHEKTDISKFYINNKGVLTLGSRNFQLNDLGQILINWYGPGQTFDYVPFWKVISINGKKPSLSPDYFKNKIVFIGVTATSQYDIKTTPLSKIYPGVELQATVFNNILDNNTIWQVGPEINLLIGILLSIITGFLVIKLRSVIASSLAVLLTILLYIISISLIFTKFFIWIGVVNQIIVITLTFIFMYIIKYIMKSRDFEYTYRLATTDGLTNLYNHRYFQENLERAIIKATKSRSPFSLIFVDIDFFKKFNDTYGHQAGDVVLQKVAQTLKKTVKSTDFVARYGGEEMAAIVYNVDTAHAITIAQRLCKKVACQKFRLSENVEVNVTISLGVATFPWHGLTPKDIIEFADQGLYRAKRDGRNQVGKIEDEHINEPSKATPPKSQG